MKKPTIHYWPESPPSHHMAKPIWDEYLLWCSAVVAKPNYKWTSNIGKVTCRKCQDRIARNHNKKSILGPVKVT